MLTARRHRKSFPRWDLRKGGGDERCSECELTESDEKGGASCFSHPCLPNTRRKWGFFVVLRLFAGNTPASQPRLH